MGLKEACSYLAALLDIAYSNHLVNALKYGSDWGCTWCG